MKKAIKILIVIFLIVCVAVIAGAMLLRNSNSLMSDAMYESKAVPATLYAFRFGDDCIETEDFYDINVPLDKIPKDGAFYKITADVSYVSGGIAGYLLKPEIVKLHKCEEISINELSFPSIEEDAYGFVSLEGYVDADYLLNMRGWTAVYKDGEWIYTYSTTIHLNDNQDVYCNEGVTEEQVSEGMENGILFCEDYFVMPIREQQ